MNFDLFDAPPVRLVSPGRDPVAWGHSLVGKRCRFVGSATYRKVLRANGKGECELEGWAGLFPPHVLVPE